MLDSERVGLVTSVERIMEHVFMEALAHPAADMEEDDSNCPMVKNLLLPGLRSFCSALRGGCHSLATLWENFILDTF